MSRHRGAKHCRRYELLGSISLLSPAYLLSVERWPFHSEPPDHYDRLSSLLDLSVSQSGRLMPLHSSADVRPAWAYLRAPPLLFRRRPPQSNYPPYRVPDQASLAAVRQQKEKGRYFTGQLHHSWRHGFKVSRLFYTFSFWCHCKVVVKVHGVFPSDRGYPASSRGIQFRWVDVGDSGEVVTPFVQVGTYPTRNFATLGPL